MVVHDAVDAALPLPPIKPQGAQNRLRAQVLSWTWWVLGYIFNPTHWFSMALYMMYQRAWTYWDEHTGGPWRWNTTWPTNRTRFILLLAIVPVWAALVLGTILLWLLLKAIVRAGLRKWPVRVELMQWPPVVERVRTRANAPRWADDQELDTLQSPHPNGNGNGAAARGHDDEEEEGEAAGLLSGRTHKPLPAVPQESTFRRVVLGTLRVVLRPLFWQCVSLFALALIGAHLAVTWENENDIRFRPIVQKAVAQPRPAGYHTGEKYYIAANFYNNAGILPRWTQEITKVIQYLGTQNVYVSIYESNSWDKSADILTTFDESLGKLNVARTILVRNKQIPSPRSRATTRTSDRIPFLATVRNMVMEPLYQDRARKAIGDVDRILFLNDVYFEAESVVELIRSRDGDWHQVCAMDFGIWGLYDAWVTRDRLGALVSSVWPYLFEDNGMNAIMRDDPAPVLACWNGITAMRALPFLSPAQRSNRTSSPTQPSPDSPKYKPASLGKMKLNPPLPLSHPFYEEFSETPPKDQPALRFRPTAPETKGPYTPFLQAFAKMPTEDAGTKTKEEGAGRLKPAPPTRSHEDDLVARGPGPHPPLGLNTTSLLPLSAHAQMELSNSNSLAGRASPNYRPMECFSSECFLTSYDFRRQFRWDRIYMNPRVVVAYDWNFYVWYKWIVRHWVVQWYIKNWEGGAPAFTTRVTMGAKEHVEQWDGGACFPFS